MQNSRMTRRIVLATALAGMTAATTAVAGPAFAADPAGSLSGVVRDGRGAVVADATVSVFLDGRIDPSQERSVDADGRFRLTGLEPGAYRLQIGLGGWSEWAPGRISDVSQAKVYQVRANRDTNATSTVTTAGTIAGRLLGPDGAPLANAPVTATNVDTANPRATVTAADGTYRIKVKPNATFTVDYTVGVVNQYVPHTFDPAEATRFFVRPGQTLRVNDRAVAAAGITGRVTDAAGAPAAGVYVTVINVDTTVGHYRTTDENGAYDLTGTLAPGRYKVQFTTADGATQYAPQQPDFASAATYTVTSGQTAVVDDQLLATPAPATN
ncbi:carboxypeptidase-like regulatory domain-containing protein [Actinoplanes utahensis]|uniref:Alpha-amylase n=1 Tax=Actinoplanes utahensis TaxID=1869 RepID=A0A0A6UE80_ACTUT|nr:carboxypeptidase-like regulatory domain-containing protein [Actinoplanes utahensis]KHD73368.1 hypothetical protein MB27_34610 [Actinoplanes utahensis]GIF30116.1 hypothetical protein Aut01nite_31020 [Actinoplanes utahensis]